MDAEVLQQIRDKILGVTGVSHGGSTSELYLQEIRDAILSVTGGVFGCLNEAIYLQEIRDAILGVTAAPGTYGNLASHVYLQQIRDAYLGVTSKPVGSQDDGIYLEEILISAVPSSVSYSISGTVYDADGGTAVASATVALGALTATSGADGTYTISNIPAGTSGSMTCTKAGYSWAPITVTAMAGNLTSQNYVNAWWAAAGVAASCQRAYKAIGAASLAASYLNLVNPGTGDATEGVAPTFAAATGWTGTGTQYLKTGLTTAVGLSWTVIIRYSNAPNFGVIFGTATAGKRWNVSPVQNTTMRVTVGAAANDLGTNQASGVVSVAGSKLYFNGVFVADLTSTSSVTSDELYMLGYNLNNALGGGFNGKIQAIAFYNAVLTAPQIAAVSTAMASLP